MVNQTFQKELKFNEEVLLKTSAFGSIGKLTKATEILRPGGVKKDEK